MKRSRNRECGETYLTFVVPLYNAQDTLRRTVESILNQTEERWRLILVNDGSTDDSDGICRDYEERYPHKINYVNQKNKGLGGARNTGMAKVRTKYVSFLDSDDWLMPDYVEKIDRLLDRGLKDGGRKENLPEIIMVLPEIYHEGSHKVKDWYDKPLFEDIFPKDGKIVRPAKELRLYQLEVSQCRKVLKMDFVRETGFTFREKVKWEDVFPHFYLLSKCNRCMGVKSTGFYCRIGNESQITASGGRDRLDLLTVIDDLFRYIEREEHRELLFPAMRIYVKFAVWCIRMADVDTRKELVDRLHDSFAGLPKAYYGQLWRGIKDYPRKDARQYQLFVTAIRKKPLCGIFYDYLVQELLEKAVKKVLRAGRRVA